MHASVFVELDFYLLVVCSLIAPGTIYVFLYLRRAISKATVLLMGLTLIALAGVDLVLLGRLSRIAAASASLEDDRWFASELSIALYLLPALFAGIGVNLVSHVLIAHLARAEARFENERADDRSDEN